MSKLAVVLLAAGQGTRMNSKTQKILHEVGGKPMIMHVFEAAESAADRRPVLVVGPGKAGVQALIGQRADYVVQAEQMGTGHAAMMAEAVLRGQTEQVIVAYGDMPLLRDQTLAHLSQTQARSGAAVVMLSVVGDPASSFGRVVRDDHGRVREIVEVAEAKQRADTAVLLAINELNVGVYCFAADWLWQNIHNLPLRQARSGQEYYLTDMIGMAIEQGQLVEAISIDDPDESLGAGTRAEMVAVEKAFRRRANRRWLENGVTLVDPDTTYIDPDVTIGQDTVIWPNTYVQGRTTIGADCVIGPNAILRQAQVGDNCRIEQAVVENAAIPDNTKVQPFTIINGQQLTAVGQR